ncbi:MAG: hypothetical protein JNJ84_03930 [Rhodobacteraceae bacterium]|nr:hypothetical protein [Paracoccaceae bacterium]
MAQEIGSTKHAVPQVAGFDVVAPLSSRTLFWRPRFLRDSAALGHLPFLFWLIDTLRPKSFVTLGGDDGVMHFALCQAVEKLDLDARGYGFGPWSSDADAAATVPGDLHAYNDEHYPDLSRLSASHPQAATASFPQGSVDLLALRLDGNVPVAELGDWLQRDWLPRMSDRGVLVLHGVNRALEQGGSDGVVARLMAAHPNFLFDAGEGLLLLLIGSQPDDRLARLCLISLGDAGYAGALQIFGRLGGAIRSEMAARAANERAAQLGRQLERSGTELADSQRRVQAAMAERDDLARQAALRETEAQAQAARLTLEAKAATAREQALSRRLEDMTADLDAHAQRQHDLATQEAEVQALTALLEDQQRLARAFAAERDALAAQLDEAEATATRLEAELAGRGAATSAQDQARLATLEAELATALAHARAQDSALQQLQATAEAQQAEAARALASLAAERDAAIAAQHGRLDQITAASEARQVEADQLHALQLQELQSRCDALTAERDSLRAEAATHQADLDRRLKEMESRLQAQDRAFVQERTLQEDEVENVKAMLREQLAAAEELRKTLKQRQDELSSLRRERDRLATHAHALDDTVQQLLNSRSWKLTAPMRKMLESVRRH